MVVGVMARPSPSAGRIALAAIIPIAILRIVVFIVVFLSNSSCGEDFTGAVTFGDVAAGLVEEIGIEAREGVAQ